MVLRKDSGETVQAWHSLMGPDDVKIAKASNPKR